jgi:hypothetical protein
LDYDRVRVTESVSARDDGYLLSYLLGLENGGLCDVHTEGDLEDPEEIDEEDPDNPPTTSDEPNGEPGVTISPGTLPGVSPEPSTSPEPNTSPEPSTSETIPPAPPEDTGSFEANGTVNQTEPSNSNATAARTFGG